MRILGESLIISGFIFVMMLVIEYINVRTQGLWQKNISDQKWKQYLLGALLGAIPGCLGAYTAVALFSHRLFSLGAIVTTMIATSGDEAFVMFAMFPEKAFLITGALILIAILSGFLTDKFVKTSKFTKDFHENNFPIHKGESCKSYNVNEFTNNIKKPSIKRVFISTIIILLNIAIISGFIMDEAPMWMKYSVIITSIFSLFVVVTVPEHFIEEHLWNHVLKIHLPKIFLWTFGTLLILGILLYNFDVEQYINNNMIFVLLLAVLIGIVPQSGPHLVFITLFAAGTIPFSVLLASSISQDGHGMLPLLAESKKSFFVVKGINIIVGLIVGYGFYFLGF